MRGYVHHPSHFTVHTSTSSVLCPDLLSIKHLGVADSWRGHTVRIFFRVLKWVTGV